MADSRVSKKIYILANSPYLFPITLLSNIQTSRPELFAYVRGLHRVVNFLYFVMQWHASWIIALATTSVGHFI